MSAPSGLLKTADVGTTMASFTVFAMMERVTVIPGRNAGSGFRRFDPHFEGGAAGIERRADQSYMAFHRIIKARNS